MTINIINKNGYYVFARYARKKAHKNSVFKKEILPGVLAFFGDIKSKLFSTPHS